MHVRLAFPSPRYIFMPLRNSCRCSVDLLSLSGRCGAESAIRVLMKGTVWTLPDIFDAILAQADQGLGEVDSNVATLGENGPHRVREMHTRRDRWIAQVSESRSADQELAHGIGRLRDAVYVLEAIYWCCHVVATVVGTAEVHD